MVKLGFYTSPTPSKCGILPKDKDESDNGEQLLVNSNALTFPEELIARIYKNAFLSNEMIKNISRIPGSYSTLSSRLIPFMSSVPSLFFRGSKSGNPASRENHESRLSDILKAWNMCRYDVEGDGNCCFTAASLSLTLNWKAFSNDERSAFAALGLLPSMDVETLAAHLRKLVVDEWLTNASYYQSFMVDSVQVEQEAVKFLDPGYFYGDLADTMVLSIANSLNVSIIVFSSIQCQPVIVITPRIQVTKLPLMLAYTQFGAGHYDAVMPCIKHTPTPTSTCACGRDDKTEKTHCQEIAQKYTTIVRCKCLLNKAGCSNACRCKNCANPCGKKENISKHSRKRFRHEWQGYAKENSAEFATNRGEEVETGPFSTLEYFVLVNIVEIGEEHGFDMDAQNILHVYQQVLDIGNDNLNPRREKYIERYTKRILQSSLRCVKTNYSAIFLKQNIEKAT